MVAWSQRRAQAQTLGVLLCLCGAAGVNAFQCALLRGGGEVGAGRLLSLRSRDTASLGCRPTAPALAARLRSRRLEMSSRAAAPQDFEVEPVEDKIPITILSGFLGSGKTTLLRQVLQNKGGLKVGVVVNDMAAINIDSKLVKSDLTRLSDTASPKSDSALRGGLLDTSDVLELQNGCACCSASEELLQSVMKLLLVSAEAEEPYDRIIIEMTGVAEPKNIRKQFFDAAWGGHPALEYSELKNMVTVVDSANFLSSYQTAEAVLDRPDLVEDDVPPVSAGRAIVDLLTEQVEVADYVLLNKADLLTESKLDQLNAIVTALNPDADVLRCSYGKVDLDVVLGQARDKWVADADDEDDFRISVRAAKAAAEAQAKAEAKAKAEAQANAHGHSHGEMGPALGHTHDGEECTDPSHGHSHGAAKAVGHTHDGEECTDPAHGHSHGAATAVSVAAEPSQGHSHGETSPALGHTHDGEECTDPSHGHSHGAATAVSVAAEPSQGHSHGETSPTHEHAHAHSSSRDLDPQDKFGISSFVYTRRRPFHPERLKKLIAKLPVSAGQDKEALEGWVLPEPENAAELGKDNPLRNIIRSKGFVWVSTYHRVALYWSHAGQFFDLKDFGMFWAATPLKYWPRETVERAQVITDFGMGEKWGDRRQEIVFIGVGMQQDKIEAIVDQALLTNAEMEEYEQSNKSTPDKVKMDWTTSPPIPVEMTGTSDKRT